MTKRPDPQLLSHLLQEGRPAAMTPDQKLLSHLGVPPDWQGMSYNHKHQWTNGDPQLFMNNLKQCRLCGEIAVNHE